MRELGEHAVELIRVLLDEPGSLEPRRAEVAAVMQRLFDESEREAATREAREEQLAAQRALIRVIACPILQVRSDVVCVPLVGPVDADRTAQLTDVLLAAVVQRRIQLVVLDVSSALVTDLTAVQYIAGVLHAVRLLGARGVLSGITPELADMISSMPDALTGIATYRALADALGYRR